MLAATSAGVSPFPKPPSLMFAETILARTLPLPVGLLFHTGYVTFWSVIFLRYFPHRDVWTALGSSPLLVVILVLSFPIVGWGIAGLAIGP
jgi:hypothetical protein